MELFVEAKNGSIRVTEDDFVEVTVISRNAKFHRIDIINTVFSKARIGEDGMLDIITKNNGNLRLWFSRTQNEEMRNAYETLHTRAVYRLKNDVEDNNVENVRMSLRCTNGILYVYDEKVTISRDTAFGVMAQGHRGDRTLYYTDMTSVEYKKPSFVSNGYIQFIIHGANEKNPAASFFGWSTSEGLKDPNTLILRAFNNDIPAESERIYNYIMENVARIKKSAIQSDIVSTPSTADEIAKFKKLLDDGAITQEEFDFKKKQLLNT